MSNIRHQREKGGEKEKKMANKNINDLSDRAKRSCRRKWVKAKRLSRMKQKVAQELELNTPPQTPERVDEPIPEPISVPLQENRRRESIERAHNKRANKQKAASLE